MNTWVGKFKPRAGLGQTQGPGGTVVNPPTSSVDQMLNLAPERNGTTRFLWDYQNQKTDDFLRRIMGLGGTLQDKVTGGAVAALTGGMTSQMAQRTLAERDRLRKGTARAFMGPDGSFSFRDQDAVGALTDPLPQGVSRLDGRGQYDPVSDALSSDSADYREIKDMTKRAGINWQAPLWLSLSRSMGGGTLPSGAWR